MLKFQLLKGRCLKQKALKLCKNTKPSTKDLIAVPGRVWCKQLAIAALIDRFISENHLLFNSRSLHDRSSPEVDGTELLI
jgi:hypothetical protein